MTQAPHLSLRQKRFLCELALRLEVTGASRVHMTPSSKLAVLCVDQGLVLREVQRVAHGERIESRSIFELTEKGRHALSFLKGTP